MTYILPALRFRVLGVAVGDEVDDREGLPVLAHFQLRVRRHSADQLDFVHASIFLLFLDFLTFEKSLEFFFQTSTCIRKTVSSGTGPADSCCHRVDGSSPHGSRTACQCPGKFYFFILGHRFFHKFSENIQILL